MIDIFFLIYIYIMGIFCGYFISKLISIKKESDELE